MNDRDDSAEQWVFLNGEMMPLNEARISPLDRGFQYGDGVFTTVRVDAGRPLYLAEHLSRLIQSLRDLRIAWEPLQDIGWPQLLGELLQRNGLQSGLAALKILVTRGVALPLGLPEGVHPTLFIQARLYQPPSLDQYARGWRLHICRSGYAPPLAGHKSLNYLFYLVARQEAIDAGADEAVILDAHGHIAETAAGSLLIRSDGDLVDPRQPLSAPWNHHSAPAKTLQGTRPGGGIPQRRPRRPCQSPNRLGAQFLDGDHAGTFGGWSRNCRCPRPRKRRAGAMSCLQTTRQVAEAE